MEHIIRMSLLETFREELAIEERSDLTIEKYVRDVGAFLHSMGENAIVTKESVIRYKRKLTEAYTPASVNSMIAALNRFFRMMEWYDCTVRSLKVQRSSFRSENKELSKEEYKRLLESARGKKDARMYLLMETLGSTGSGHAGKDQSVIERKDETGTSAYRTSEKAARLCRTEKNQHRQYFYHPYRKTYRSKQCAACHETVGGGSRHITGESISAQFSAFICVHVLPEGKRPVPPGRSPGAFQYQYDKNLHMHQWGRAGSEAQEPGIGHITEK